MGLEDVVIMDGGWRLLSKKSTGTPFLDGDGDVPVSVSLPF